MSTTGPPDPGPGTSMITLVTGDGAAYAAVTVRRADLTGPGALAGALSRLDAELARQHDARDWDVPPRLAEIMARPARDAAPGPAAPPGLACSVCLYAVSGTAAYAVTIINGLAVCDDHAGYVTGGAHASAVRLAIETDGRTG